MVSRLARLTFCTLFLAVAGVGRAIAPAEVLGVKVEDSSTLSGDRAPPHHARPQHGFCRARDVRGGQRIEVAAA
jgi:hypothetical protein